MSYELHKNGVITGCLNSFCLACDVFVQSEGEAKEHITTSQHTRNLGTVNYSDKFKDEHIRKFKLGYFCEFCNILLPIASKVTLHVTEDEHKHNKGIQLLKPMGRDVVAFNNIHIEEKAWHGLTEEICSVCNEEFDDEAEHKSGSTHCLNLVLKPVKFGADNAIYRHIDDSAVQCLTCNKLIAPNMMSRHFTDSDHQKLYLRRRIESNGVREQTEIPTSPALAKGSEIKENNVTIGNDNKNDKKSPVKENSKIFECIGKYQSKGININLETETAFCKTCSEVITFEFKEIENHIESHSRTESVDSKLKYPSTVDQNLNRVDINDKSTKISEYQFVENNTANENETEHSENKSDEEVKDTCGSSSAEARDYANEHFLTYNEAYGPVYCRICDVKLPSSLRSMKEHVSGATHKKMVQSSPTQQDKPPSHSAITKMELKNWLESSYTVENMFFSDTIVNEEYCMPKFSFWMITSNRLRFRCVACDVNIPLNSDVGSHITSETHHAKMGAVYVITSEKSEFIREIRHGAYHCGFCNLVVPNWNDMKQHLKCSDHSVNKARYERRLNGLMPMVQEHKREKEVELLRMLFMLRHI